MVSEKLVGMNWTANVYPGNQMAVRFPFNTSFQVNPDSGNSTEAMTFVNTCRSFRHISREQQQRVVYRVSLALRGV